MCNASKEARAELRKRDAEKIVRSEYHDICTASAHTNVPVAAIKNCSARSFESLCCSTVLQCTIFCIAVLQCSAVHGAGRENGALQASLV